MADDDPIPIFTDDCVEVEGLLGVVTAVNYITGMAKVYFQNGETRTIPIADLTKWPKDP